MQTRRTQLHAIIQSFTVKKKLFHQQYETKQRVTEFQVKRYTETVQLYEKFQDVKPALLTMIKIFVSPWDDNLGHNNVSKHQSELNPTHKSLVQSVPYFADSKQQELLREEIERRLRQAWMNTP